MSIQNKGNTIADCLNIFNEKTEYGPLYVCTVCLQTWFKSSVYDDSKLFLKMQIQQDMFAECSKGFTSVNYKGWLCRTCFAIKQGKVPRLLVKNGMGFTEHPTELQLYPVEEHLISPVLIFFQMRCNPIGGQAFAWGSVVNITVDIAHTVKLLPQNLSDTQTVAIKFKHKKEYKKCKYHENIRPLCVWKAAYYLMQNSDLYKNLGIKHDTKWLNHVVNKESDIENMSSIVNEHDIFPSTSNDNYSNASGMNAEVVCDEIDEDDKTCTAVDRDTMFDDDPYPKELIFAPGERKKTY